MTFTKHHYTIVIVSSKRTIKDPDSILHFGTLQDLLRTGPNSVHDGLNVLDLPMGGTVLPPPPQYG
jgi:hypothetical protein